MKPCFFFAMITFFCLTTSCEPNIEDPLLVRQGETDLNTVTGQKITVLSGRAAGKILERMLTPQVSQEMNARHLSVREVHQVHLADGRTYYGMLFNQERVAFRRPPGSAVNHDATYLAYIPENPVDEQHWWYHIKGTDTEPTYFHTKNMDNTTMAYTDTDPGSETCVNSTPNFTKCMNCSMKILRDDWVGFLMCSANQWIICAIASAIHCAQK